MHRGTSHVFHRDELGRAPWDGPAAPAGKSRRQRATRSCVGSLTVRTRVSSAASMDIILIGGVSGSGKSVALGALEDSGYYAVANLPLSLVAETARLPAARRPGSHRRHVRPEDRCGARRRARRDGRVARRRLERALPRARREDRHAGQALLGDAPPPSVLERRAARSPRRSSSSARCSPTCASSAFVFDTSDLSGGRAAQLDQGFRRRRRVAADAAVRVVRLQARRAARRRPGVRRALPSQPALRAGAVAADRTRRAGRRVPRTRCPRSSACTATSTISSRAGCPTTRATTATTSPSRSAAPAGATAPCTSSSAWRAHSSRATRCLKRHREIGGRR